MPGYDLHVILFISHSNVIQMYIYCNDLMHTEPIFLNQKMIDVWWSLVRLY